MSVESPKMGPYLPGDDLLKEDAPIEYTKPTLSLKKEWYSIPENPEKLRRFHPEIVLYCPQIPQNTGTVARLCAAFGCTLHLIEPMAFQITEKSLRRAGLDYWEYVRVYVHKSWENFCQTRVNRRFIFVETGGTSSPYQFQFLPGDVLIFGAETFGIPKKILQEALQQKKNHCLTIPMFHEKVRSINLANTVSMVTYLAIEKIWA